MSVPAPGAGARPDRRATGADVTPITLERDLSGLLSAAAANPDLSDKALRVYTLVVTAFDREVTAQAVAALLSINETTASRLLGTLVTAGLLRKRLRVIGYKDGQRVRRGVYTLTGVTE